MVAEAKEPRNGKTAYYPVWHAGGCYQLANNCPDVLKDPELAGSLLNKQNYGLGTNPGASDMERQMTRQILGKRYPVDDIEEDDPTVFRPAVHRSPAVLDINRTISFKKVYDKQLRKPFANQDEILRMYRDIRDCIELPVAFGMVFAPMKTGIEAVHYCIRCPVPGIEFDILESYSGDVIASGVDGGVEGSALVQTFDKPWSYSHDKNRAIDLCITSMPDLNDESCKDGPGGLDGFEISIAMKLCCLGLSQ